MILRGAALLCVQNGPDHALADTPRVRITDIRQRRYAEPSPSAIILCNQARA
jgi:hypothetical protein